MRGLRHLNVRAEELNALWDDRWRELVDRGVPPLGWGSLGTRVSPFVAAAREQGRTAAIVELHFGTFVLNSGATARDRAALVAQLRAILPEDASPVDYLGSTISLVTAALRDRNELEAVAARLHRMIMSRLGQEPEVRTSDLDPGPRVCAAWFDADDDLSALAALNNAPETVLEWPIRVRTTSEHGRSVQDFLSLAALTNGELPRLAREQGQLVLAGLGVAADSLPRFDHARRLVVHQVRDSFRSLFRRVPSDGSAPVPATCFELDPAGRTFPVAALVRMPAGQAGELADGLARTLSAGAFVMYDHRYGDIEIAKPGSVQFRTAALSVKGADATGVVGELLARLTPSG